MANFAPSIAAPVPVMQPPAVPQQQLLPLPQVAVPPQTQQAMDADTLATLPPYFGKGYWFVNDADLRQRHKDDPREAYPTGPTAASN